MTEKKKMKHVLMEVTFRIIHTVPDDWESKMCEFHLNGSSLCISNVLDKLEEVAKEKGCACTNLVSAKFIKEADADDVFQYLTEEENETYHYAKQNL